MLRVFCVLAILYFGHQAFAVTPPEILNGLDLQQAPRVFQSFQLDERYRIGDEWGKKPVTEGDLASDSHFRRMALATARVRGGGTGFYLGKFNGRHLIATNNHVCESKVVCDARNAVNFTLVGVRATMSQWIGTWTDIDLAIFAIEFDSAADEFRMEGLASPFSFQKELAKDTPLVTIGFGVANNPARQMVANRDSDCRVFSETGDYRHMRDPDELNTGPHRVWSFANGCDVSHGDSGSAMMNRETGDVIGIIWTGRIPKNPVVQSSSYLENLTQEEVWGELSYGVPAVSIGQFLNEEISEGKISGDRAQTLAELLSGH